MQPAPFHADAAPGVFAQIIADAPRPLRELCPDVPPALEAVCARCLQKRAEDRYRDVTALTQALLDSLAPPREVEPEAQFREHCQFEADNQGRRHLGLVEMGDENGQTFVEARMRIAFSRS